MKKVSLLVIERESEAVLVKLRELGVVHLKNKSVSAGIPLELYSRQIKNRQALAVLLKYEIDEKEEPAPSVSFIPAQDEFADHILTLIDSKKLLLDEIPSLVSEKRRIEFWGNFYPSDFHFLEEKGVKLSLYNFPALVLKRLSAETDYIVLSRDKHMVKVLVTGPEIPGMSSFILPELPLSEIESSLEAITERLQGIDARLAELAYHRNIIYEDNRQIQEEIEFETARGCMETTMDVPPEMAVTGLSGFVPAERIDTVIDAARKNGWTFAWDDPVLIDRPPTILRNKPAVRIIQPLFSMLGTIPGYWEHDISLSYMVFLSLFFAMIFGDAGYGLFLFSVGALIGILQKKKSGQFPDVAKLIMVFASCTTVWGALTGSWFNIPIGNLPFALRIFVLPPFNNTGPVAEFPLFLRNIFNLPDSVPVDELKTRWNIQFLCFTIGLVQLVFARITNLKKLLPSLAAIAQAGWILAMTGVYFFVLFMLLKVEPPSFAPWLIGAGIILNFIFAEQKGGNFFVNVAKSFSNFFSIFLKAIGCFADIISYIRLFAVGLAGSMIARTFNSMAIPPEGLGSFSLGFILKLLSAIVVLLGGHGLNMLMSTLSVIIHGVRLNLLEFAGNHLGMDWSGYAYRPFASGQKESNTEEA